MATIHPSSVVDPGAELDSDVLVGPHCYVGPQVRIAGGTRLVSHVAVMGRTTLGRGNTLWCHTSLGTPPQDLKFQGEDAQLIVGDHNDIRESVTMHPGTAHGGLVTRLGDHNLLMVGCHIAHDCCLGSHLVLANNVLLAGHVRIDDHAVLSGAAAVHHFVSIGPYAFIGGMTRIVHDVPPFMIIEGNPSKIRGVNRIGMERNRIPVESQERIKEAYRRLYRGRQKDRTAGRTAQALASLESDFAGDPFVAMLCQFIHRSTGGIHGRFLEAERPDEKRNGPAR